jgi:hypothetical protein
MAVNSTFLQIQNFLNENTQEHNNKCNKKVSSSQINRLKPLLNKLEPIKSTVAESGHSGQLTKKK